MNAKRSICVVTGSRADYGLLKEVMRGISNSVSLELQVVVTGMHLSPEFGLTYREIESDGFLIDRKVETLLSSDSPASISKSMGLGMIGFADVLDELNPDLILVLGDRFEIFSVVSAATIAQIPVAHVHGGENTEGSFDEALRHAITKMSHIHFTAAVDYRRRVIQLGEQPNNVLHVGALGIDSLKQIKFMTKTELEDSIGIKLAKRNLLVTFHPVTLEKGTAETQFRNILYALDELENTHFIFTKANADTGGRVINKLIDAYVVRNPHKSASHDSLGRLRYASAIRFMDGVVGNSSSGIIEVPSFKIGTINIGDRQIGRIKADSVIDCEPNYQDIKNALKTLYSDEFQQRVKATVNPYYKGSAVEQIIKHITEIPLDGILKKKFFNLMNEER